MSRRLLVVSLGGLIAALVASPALSAAVQVRIESRGATIWGATEPRLKPIRGTFSPPDGPDVTVTGRTPLGALERASRRGDLYYRVQNTSFGPYVDRIGRRAAGSSFGWVYKVNHVSPPVGADVYRLENGDTVLWYWATFGPAGGPKTLDLARIGNGCFRAFAYDDNGDRSRPRNIVFVRDHSRRIPSQSGRYCPSGEWDSLRAVKPGTVRSDRITR